MAEWDLIELIIQNWNARALMRGQPEKDPYLQNRSDRFDVVVLQVVGVRTNYGLETIAARVDYLSVEFFLG